MTSRAVTAERGSGTLGATFGVSVVLSLLMLSSHLLLNLWVRSGIDAVAHDAAADVATSGASDAELPAVRRRALERASDALGGYRDRVDLRFEPDPSGATIRLRVVAPGLRLLPGWVAAIAGDDGIDRTITVEREIPDSLADAEGMHR